MNNLDVIKFFPQILTTIFLLIAYTIYWTDIKRKGTQPVLATWLILPLAAILSALTNLEQNGIGHLFDNYFNIIDIIVTFSTLIFIFFNKNTRKEFNGFEKKCLLAVVIVFLAWLATGQNILTHLAIQIILIIAYLPTFVHLWRNNKNTESLGMWLFSCFACFFGVIGPLQARAFLPFIYGFRSFVSTLVVVILILRLKYKKIT